MQNNNVNPSSSSSKPPLLDPTPSLIDEDGNLINNINLAASITTQRNGTITDGVSKLILLVDSNNPLKFSINRTNSDDLANGMLSSLSQSNVSNLLALTMLVLIMLVMENQLLLQCTHLQTHLIKTK